MFLKGEKHMGQISELLYQKMKPRLSREQGNIFEEFLNGLSYQTVVTVERASRQLSLDHSLVDDVLAALVEIGKMEKTTCVRCPECNLLFASIPAVDDMEREMFCYGCEKEVTVDETDVEVIFMLCRNKN